eukprot:CAMPEP_0194066236 /NCGR_PEP_ID=MMETSP0009_2-20130614/85907_1 /TAXON_ID=210454 /ORGANISM="Grammatophora oceanica, Strain CCMP 410" /LENGTH=38 /DNA_ID= /DNA_START= /DNA_END= /DNA_ORIENTATION=
MACIGQLIKAMENCGSDRDTLRSACHGIEAWAKASVEK